MSPGDSIFRGGGPGTPAVSSGGKRAETWAVGDIVSCASPVLPHAGPWEIGSVFGVGAKTYRLCVPGDTAWPKGWQIAHSPLRPYPLTPATTTPEDGR